MSGWRAEKPASSPYAYVTLASNADFALGAKALLRSLTHSATKADLVVLCTGGVPQDALVPLRARGARIVHIDLLPTSDEFNMRHAKRNVHDKAPFTKGNKPSFHTPLDNFCKLRLWQLDYEKIVFLDADTLVLRNCDSLFDYPEFSAAPNVYESLADFHRLNSGVFTAKPSEKTFNQMLEKLDAGDVFWRRTDQTFFETYFPHWHGLPVTYNMLQYVWFNMPDLWRWSSIHVLHFQYEKPWQSDHPKGDKLKPLIDLWHIFEGEGDLPDIQNLPNPK